MLEGGHSAILSTFIKLPFVIKIFVLSIFEWPSFYFQRLEKCVVAKEEIEQDLYSKVTDTNCMTKIYSRNFVPADLILLGHLEIALEPRKWSSKRMLTLKMTLHS